jgi:hypothetical protein
MLPRKVSKLFIYDALDDDNREQAEGRFDDDYDITPLPCRSLAHLMANLDLLKGRFVFSHVLFQTHGGPGRITIGPDRLYWTTFTDTMKDSGYDALFPFYTLIYFDGCNVAAADGLDEGLNFLSAVGHAWLLRAGGQGFGWTSAGYASWGSFPLIGGHTMHFTGNVVRLYFGPGGRMVNPP